MKAVPKIILQAVTSSQFAAIGHAPDLNILAIQFHPKKSTGVADVYHYENFTAAQFAEFLAADSQGSYFIHHVKKQADKHPFAKIEVQARPNNDAQLERDHVQALDINARCYGEPLPSGQRYSTSTFKDNGDPIMLNADGKRSVFCDLCDDMEVAA